MSDQADTIHHLAEQLGLELKAIDIYLLLLKQGPQTALAISRQLHIGRTQVYRLLDTLKQPGLVEPQLRSRGYQFAASPPDQFQHLVADREQQLATIKQDLPSLISQLSSLTTPDGQRSRIVTYQGLEGLKQVSYNITKARDLLRVWEVAHLSDFLPHDYAEMIRSKLVENQITTHDITNQSSFPDFTKVQAMVSQYSQYRYIDPQVLQIEFESLIYNDVYAIYSYQPDQIFCVEIYNPHLAQMQKQIFDYIWTQAQPMTTISPGGAAKVVN